MGDSRSIYRFDTSFAANKDAQLVLTPSPGPSVDHGLPGLLWLTSFSPFKNERSAARAA
jgi:hypothetical protein